MSVMRQRPSQQAGSASPPAIGDWRRRRLTAAGFEPRLAADLADQPEVDLHELLILLDRGCPPELAARILAPLDADSP